MSYRENAGDTVSEMDALKREADVERRRARILLILLLLASLAYGAATAELQFAPKAFWREAFAALRHGLMAGAYGYAAFSLRALVGERNHDSCGASLLRFICVTTSLMQGMASVIGIVRLFI